ncbi:MAG: Glycosyl transferase, family 2 [Candidatus Levybacteria bacterium GW2011_GWB1_36_18]|nr:MAG: Glycosyl transferase, family 2 [Candidatus Levybacteria bacterium GW2011_GWB1_36_18]
MLSLVIPAYKREQTVVKNLKAVEKALKEYPHKYEIILVVDGMTDRTFEKAKTVKSKNIRVFGYKKNQGKGHAVKLGMSKARGDIIGFMDAGLDIDPSGILILLNFMKLHEADIVVGSKTHPDSEVKYPLYRRLISLGGRFVTQFLFGFSVLDTQVGLKFFKRKVAKDVFPRLLVKKFAFDIEMLAVANVLGYKKIYEAPVRLNFEFGNITYSSLIVVLLRTLWDTLAVFYRIRILKYYRKSNRRNWLK